VPTGSSPCFQFTAKNYDQRFKLGGYFAERVCGLRVCGCICQLAATIH
jgi:hypothetical protein